MEFKEDFSYNSSQKYFSRNGAMTQRRKIVEYECRCGAAA